jgi:long-chain acyl-CoA synthetase
MGCAGSASVASGVPTGAGSGGYAAGGDTSHAATTASTAHLHDPPFIEVTVSTRHAIERATDVAELCRSSGNGDCNAFRGDRLPALESVVGFELPREEPSSFAALLEKGHALPVAPVPLPSNAIADIVYTSGTTGKPKGVVLSHGNIISNVNAVLEVFPLEPSDRSLSFLPWAHCYGQTCEVHAMLSMGCSVALNDTIGNLATNLRGVRPSVFFTVPRIFNRMYDAVWHELAQKPPFLQKLVRNTIENATERSLAPGDALVHWLVDKLVFAKVRARFGGRLKYVLTGSAALCYDVARFVDALGVTVYEGYGLTETSPLATANYPGHRKLGSVGKPLPDVRVVIAPLNDSEREGEIVVYGPNVMQGYYRRPEETAAALLPDGGLRTGDLGYLDDDGYLYVTGRIKEQFKLTNGKYVHPAPLEEQLRLAPHVSNVFVYGDNREYCVALVVLNVPNVKSWLLTQGFEPTELETDERVRDLVAREIAAQNRKFRSFERIKAFALLTEDFTAEDGLLTPTLKLRRHKVVAKYRNELETLGTNGASKTRFFG